MLGSLVLLRVFWFGFGDIAFECRTQCNLPIVHDASSRHFSGLRSLMPFRRAFKILQHCVTTCANKPHARHAQAESQASLLWEWDGKNPPKTGMLSSLWRLWEDTLQKLPENRASDIVDRNLSEILSASEDSSSLRDHELDY